MAHVGRPCRVVLLVSARGGVWRWPAWAADRLAQRNRAMGNAARLPAHHAANGCKKLGLPLTRRSVHRERVDNQKIRIEGKSHDHAAIMCWCTFGTRIDRPFRPWHMRSRHSDVWPQEPGLSTCCPSPKPCGNHHHAQVVERPRSIRQVIAASKMRF